MEDSLKSVHNDIPSVVGSSSNEIIPLGKPLIKEEAIVKNARSKFRSSLKHMAQEILQADHESDSDEENRLSRAAGNLNLGSKGGKFSEPTKSNPTFVMKLFDRGVDLAQFTTKSPLYPICRAWIVNKPHANRQKRDIDADADDVDPEEMDYRDESEEVFTLPPPDPLPYDEYGNQISYRIPLPIQRSPDEPSFDINYNDDDAPSPALLFQNHLDRWNLVRNRWKDACALNESRYSECFSIIRHIYDRNRPEDIASSDQNQTTHQDGNDVIDEEMKKMHETTEASQDIEEDLFLN